MVSDSLTFSFSLVAQMPSSIETPELKGASWCLELVFWPLFASEQDGGYVGEDSEQHPCQGKCEMYLADLCYLKTAVKIAILSNVLSMHRLFSNVTRFLAPLVRDSLTFHVPNNKHG